MATPRLFVDLTLTTGAQLTLPKTAAHHIATVLRREAGSSVILFNGQGGEYHCTLVQSDRKGVIVEIGSHDPVDRDAPLQIHLGMSILKKDPMDAVLGRVVELGVREITPIISDHCAVSAKMIKTRYSHWAAVIISSCEQCGLNRPPQLHTPVSTDDWMNTINTDSKLIALPGETSLDTSTNPKDIALLVGPEGGFSERELALANAADFQAVTFGDRVLRAETAPVVALSVLHRNWGDF